MSRAAVVWEGTVVVKLRAEAAVLLRRRLAAAVVVVVVVLTAARTVTAHTGTGTRITSMTA